MMCFRDSTYCTYFTTCEKGATCSRALTEKVNQEAIEWWGKGKDDPPICVYLNEPDCYKEIKE